MGSIFSVVHKAFRPLDREQVLDAAGHVVEAINVERELHAALAAELVHQDAAAGVSLDILKQQSRPAGSALCFGHPVGDFSDLEDGIHRFVDVFQLSGLIQRLDPTP
jgi:hypothetical protein